MSTRNPKVDPYFKRLKKWKQELLKLREFLLDSELQEELKRYHPCYMFQGGNVILLGDFKEYCTISFIKGALLKDPKKILSKPGEATQSARLIRFTNLQDINKLESTLKAYIHEATEIEKKGLKVVFKDPREVTIPAELEQVFRKNAGFKKAFYALTPGRQRAYLLHFSDAKQSVTRIARIEKYTQHILDGKGMQDR